MNPDSFPGFLFSAQPARPTSRGSVQIQSTNPLEHPRIYPNYLSTQYDVEEMLEGSLLLRNLAANTGFTGIIESEILLRRKLNSADELIADIRSRAITVFHPVGTYRMGDDQRWI